MMEHGDKNGIVEALKSILSGLQIKPLELFEPDLFINMAERAGDPQRQFKHLHQASLLHTQHFICINQIKLCSLLDGYLKAVSDLNAIGIYLFARSILELMASLREISRRLNSIKEKDEKSWIPKGEEFFNLIVRARYATSHPVRLKMLQDMGVNKDRVKPFDITNCIEELRKDEELGDLADEYDALSDYTHHNLSSQITASDSVRAGSSIKTAGGGGMILPKRGSIVRYALPLKWKPTLAIEETAEIVHRCVVACIQYINSFPQTPFSDALCIKFTGSADGLTRLT